MGNERVWQSDRTGLRLTWGVATTPGHVRQVNEDAAWAEDGVFVVADGMGGHQAGDVASRLAVDAFAAIEASATRRPSVVSEAVGEANRRVRAYADEHDRAGMGTTVVGVVLVDNGGDDSLVVVNVGDSRCYLTVDGGTTQLTHDHSMVQEMVDGGELTSEEARQHRLRNVITRAVGIAEEVSADFLVAPVHPSMRLLLCSDGVFGELGDDHLDRLLRTDDDPQTVADAIVAEVLVGSARDNATVIVVDVERPHLVTTGSDVHVEITAPRSALSRPSSPQSAAFGEANR